MIMKLKKLIESYVKIFKWGNYIIIESLKDTLVLVLIAYLIAIVLGFGLGLFLYKIHIKKNKIQKNIYSTITKGIHILTHVPFLFFCLFIIMFFLTDETNEYNKNGNFWYACYALTSHLTLMFSKKIEKIFSNYKKNFIVPIKKIIKDKKIWSDLILTMTYLFISGILYSTIACGSFGGTTTIINDLNEKIEIKGTGLGAIAYNFGFLQTYTLPKNITNEIKDINGKDIFIVCFIIIIITIQLIKFIGVQLSKKIKNHH